MLGRIFVPVVIEKALSARALYSEVVVLRHLMTRQYETGTIDSTQRRIALFLDTNLQSVVTLRFAILWVILIRVVQAHVVEVARGCKVHPLYSKQKPIWYPNYTVT